MAKHHSIQHRPPCSHQAQIVLAGIFLLGQLLLPSLLLGQNEVPRALPYRPGEGPVKARRVVPPTEAIPPGSTPAPRIVRPDDVYLPSPAQPQPQPQPQPQQPGDPEEDLFTYASLAFSSGYYDVAAGRLQTYLQNYPAGRHLQAAYFRLGECQLKLGDKEGAARSYTTLVEKHPKGDFLALAAYRTASLSYQAKDLTRALSYFTIARKATEERRPILQKHVEEANAQGAPGAREKAINVANENDRLWLSSAYYLAYCLQATGRVDEALAAYRVVAAKKENNEYLDATLREIARLSTTTGDQSGALEALGEISSSTSDEKLRAEAMIRAAILHGDAGEPEKSRELLKEALQTNPGGYWGTVGNYTLLHLLYRDGDHAGVSDLFGKIEIEELPDNLRPKLLLTVGNAQRKRQLYVRAIESYSMVEDYYPEADETAEAGYLKLICFYKIKDRDLPEFVDRYVLNMTKRDNRTFVDRALLLRAEHHFREGDLAAAGSAYVGVDPDNIPEAVRASMLYNRGWCESETGLHKQAIQTLTRFLTDHPDHGLAPSVFATRALSYRALGNPASALKDLDHILANHPGTPAAEMAFQQSGLIHGEQQDWKAMVESFDGLIKNFPESIALAEAHFFSGKGRFDLKRFEEAIPLLRRAAELDEAYLPRAQMRIVLAYYFLQQPGQLAEEIDFFLEKDADAAIDPKVLSWLGAKYFEEGNFPAAARYLRLGVTPEKPASTLPIVWMYLAQAESESGQHEGAIEAIDFYLDVTKHPSSRARGFLVKAEAHIQAGELDEADEAAREGLQLQKEGRINAELLIAQGDIALARGNHRDAAAKFVVVGEIFVDPLITPTAMKKAAAAYRAAGLNEEADEVLQQLAERFAPTPPETPSPTPRPGSAAPPPSAPPPPLPPLSESP